MIARVQISLVLVCLCFYVAASPQAEPIISVQPAELVVHAQDQLQSILASGKPTPLDALTPYGKRRFISTIRWGRDGLGGFSTLPLVRELDIQKLAKVLQFLDSARYLPMLGKGVVGAPLRLPQPATDVEQGLLQLERAASVEVEKRMSVESSTTTLGASAVLRRYEELFGDRMEPAALKRQPSGDLLPLFDAATLVSTDNPDSAALTHMLLIQRELNARGIDTSRTLDDAVLTAMLGARRFEQARAFAATRPHLAKRTIPRVVDQLGPGFSGRSVFHYEVKTNTLTRAAAPYPAGTELIMVVDAGCHFSRDALNAISSDAKLQVRMRNARLMLITPPRAAVDLQFIAEWNAANPSLRIQIPYNAKEWQAVDVAGVPEFYLLKNGRVIGQPLSGWPSGGNKAALMSLIDSGT
jgi:hypothetical protein